MHKFRPFLNVFMKVSLMFRYWQLILETRVFIWQFTLPIFSENFAEFLRTLDCVKSVQLKVFNYFWLKKADLWLKLVKLPSIRGHDSRRKDWQIVFKRHQKFYLIYIVHMQTSYSMCISEENVKNHE